MTKIISKKQKGNNRHWKNFLDKNYLGSHNLEEGEEMLLTIAKFVGEEQVQSPEGKKVKPVIYFEEDVPKMILNITNGDTLAFLYGVHPDGWVGKKIQVYAAKVKAFGKVQDALRIRDFKPKTQVDITAWKKQLDTAKTIAELGEMWSKLPAGVKTEKEIIAYKDQLKLKLQ